MSSQNDIIQLIYLADNEYQKDDRFTIIHAPYFWALVLTVLLFIVITFSSLDIGTRLPTEIALLALIVLLGDEVIRSVEDIKIKQNYNRIKNKWIGYIEVDQLPLLKALITMKAKEDSFTLKEMYKLDSSLFTKEKLLQRLYK